MRQAADAARARRVGLIVLVLVALGFCCLRAASSLAEAGAAGGLPDTTHYEPATPPSRGAEIVDLGIEPIGFDDVSVADQNFKTSFYIWWRWRGKIDPVPTTDVLNAASA